MTPEEIAESEQRERIKRLQAVEDLKSYSTGFSTDPLP